MTTTGLLPQIPQPPVGMPPPPDRPLLMVAGYALVALSLVVAVRLSWRQRSVIPVAFIAGGAVATLWEPIVSTLGLCWFPTRDGDVVFTALGRPIPILLLVSYTWFVGGQALYVYTRLQRGVRRRELWLTYAAMAIVNFTLEATVMELGYAAYYGDQPFVVLRMPLWWLAVNPMMPITAAILVHTFRSQLGGWRALAVVGLVPMTDGLVNGALAWPTWLALNSDVASITVHVAALVTMASGCAMMGVLAGSVAVTRSRPADSLLWQKREVVA